MRPEPAKTTERLRVIAYDECVHDEDDVDTLNWAAKEIDQLSIQINILRQYINEDVYQRIAIENGWEHEIGNPLGRWCCDEHREAFKNGTLYPH